MTVFVSTLFKLKEDIFRYHKICFDAPNMVVSRKKVFQKQFLCVT